MITSRNTIKRRVDQLLASANITQPAVDVKAVARGLGLRIEYMTGDNDISGCLVRKDGQAIIGVNPEQHSNRQRFTIAHELGHYFLHSGRPYYVDRITSFAVNFRGAGLNGPEEREANSFAAELLMPADFIRQDFESYTFDLTDEDRFRNLAQRYEVSAQALMYRLSNLGLLPS